MKKVMWVNPFEGIFDAPQEVTYGKWNWGGFLWGPIWGLGNGMAWPFWVGLVLGILFKVAGLTDELAIQIFSSAYSLSISIWFGLKGNEIAWTQEYWSSVERFRHVQKQWIKWWFYIIIGLPVLLLLIFFIILLIYKVV